MPKIETLTKLNIASFLQSQVFLFPVLLLFYQYHGLTVSDFFLFQGIYSLTRLLLEVPSGYLGDLFTKKSMLIISYAFFIFRCFLLIFFAQYGFWIILAGEVLFGAEKAFFSGAIDSYIYEYLEKHQKRGSMSKQYGKLWAFIAAGATISSFCAPWLYHIISKYSLSHWQQDYGFIVLILIELIFNVSAIVLVWQLPKIQPFKRNKKSIKRIYLNFLYAVGHVFKRQDLRYHILFAASLWGVAILFVGTFQPMLQTLMFPVAMYGLVYFINHLVRMVFSAKTEDVVKRSSLSGFGLIVFTGFAICFILFAGIIKVQPLPSYINLLYFLFISLVIGCQVIFSNITTTYIHYIVSPAVRATVSSIYSMFGQLFSSIYLILLKFMMDCHFSMLFSMEICFCLFGLGVIPLLKIVKQEKGKSIDILQN